MVSNYDRIFAEITNEAATLGDENDIDPAVLVALVMEIVDLEDQNRTKAIRIKQLVEDRIVTAAQTIMSAAD